MKYTLRAAIAALSIGSIPTAMAAEDGSNLNTVFSEVPGVIVQAPTQTVPGQRQSAQTNASSGRGGWLFPPIGNYLNQRAG